MTGTPRPAEFTVVRILGNELPPRDTPGQRLRVLQFILTHEQHFPLTEKWYIVNRIHDTAYFALVRGMLEAHKANYVVIPFKPPAPGNRRERIQQAIEINYARNEGVRLSRARAARFAVILDGDCFFNRDGWSKVASTIHTDQRQHATRRYYSIPHLRTTIERHGNPVNEAFGEPMLVFRDDAPLLFDETIPFGEGDKLKLLFRIGHDQTPGRHYRVVGPQAKSTGYVLHLGTGEPRADENAGLRQHLRNLSLDKFLERIEAQA